MIAFSFLFYTKDGQSKPSPKDNENKLHVSISNGNLTSSINISEEVNKTTIWKQVNDGKLFFTKKLKDKSEEQKQQTGSG